MDEKKTKLSNDSLQSEGCVQMASSIGGVREGAFYSSLGLLIILNIIIKPFWIFGIDRHVQNVVGIATYGAYFSLFNFSIVFSFLLDWGLTAFYNRQLAVQKENFINRAGDFLFIKLMFSAIYAVVVYAVAWASGIRRWDILWGVIAIQVFTSLFIFFRGIIAAQQWFRTDAWLSVLDKALMILIASGFLYFPSVAGKMTILIFLLAQIVCTALAIAVVLIILFKKRISFSLKSGYLVNRPLLQSALPFAIIILLMSAHYRLDGFLLDRMHINGAYEAGLYAGAYRLLDAANMIGYLLASFLLPFIARQWSLQNDISEVVLNSRHLLIVFSLAVSITVIFLASWIQQMLYHNDDAAAVNILQWCLPALLGYSLVQVYGTVMTATGHIVPFCYITLLSVVLNVVLNLLLIPGLGARGCCYAALASQSFCGIATLIYVRQKMHIPVQLRSLLIYFFMAAMLCGFFYLCRSVTFSKWFLIAGAAVIILTIAIVTKLFTISKWKNLFNGTL